MFCPSCGQSNPDEAKFCGKCGAAIAATAAPKPVHVEPGAKDTGVVSQTMKTWMLVASIVLPVVGIVVGIVYLLDANPEKKESGKLWLIVGIVAAVIWSALFGA